MSIDWASVNWAYIALLSGFAFVAALIANFITFGHRFVGAILTALLFAAVFVFQRLLTRMAGTPWGRALRADTARHEVHTGRR
jgi:hypothetical protein